MTNERFSIPTRVISALLRLPDALLLRFAGGERMQADGRTLNLRVQAVIRSMERMRSKAEWDRHHERAAIRQATKLALGRRIDVSAVDRLIPAVHGHIPVRVYRPLQGSLPLPGIVYAHGGGWAVGDIESHDRICQLVAAESGCVVASVDYRLAPEHVFPAAVDDMLTAWCWANDEAASLGIDPARIGVMGDSAGGTLAAVLVQQACAHGLPRPVAQCLIYPATDLRMQTRSIDTFATGFGLTKEQVVRFRDLYLRDEADRLSPLASPLLAKDLAGLPPALVVTAGFDVLRDEGRAYARAMADAGVDVTDRCFDALTHAFFGMGVVPECKAAMLEISRWMGDRMFGRSAA